MRRAHRLGEILRHCFPGRDLNSPDRGGAQNGAISDGNRKAFDENPVLREIYSRSPLAALRMLKRLREAAGKN